MMLCSRPSSSWTVLRACSLVLSAGIGMAGLAAAAVNFVPSQTPVFVPHDFLKAQSAHEGSQILESSVSGAFYLVPTGDVEGPEKLAETTLTVPQAAVSPLAAPLEQALGSLSPSIVARVGAS